MANGHVITLLVVDFFAVAPKQTKINREVEAEGLKCTKRMLSLWISEKASVLVQIDSPRLLATDILEAWKGEEQMTTFSNASKRFVTEKDF